MGPFVLKVQGIVGWQAPEAGICNLPARRAYATPLKLATALNIPNTIVLAPISVVMLMNNEAIRGDDIGSSFLLSSSRRGSASLINDVVMPKNNTRCPLTFFEKVIQKKSTGFS